jgi:hypothetical protein
VMDGGNRKKDFQNEIAVGDPSRLE